MKKRMVVVGLVFAAQVSAAPVAFTHARLFDGTAQAIVDDSLLIIEDGGIVYAGPSDAGVAVPVGAQVHDLTGKFVMPGLVSDHSHVGQTKGVSQGPENYTKENIVSQLEAYEARGVTTVMTLGLNGALFQELRREAHAGTLGGADVYGVDRGIGVPNGAPPDAMLKVGADQLFRPSTPEEAREAVRAMKARETDLVKIWVDAFGGSLPVKMKPEVYKAVIDESHKLGLRVAAHVHDLQDAMAVMTAGVDIVAHGVRDQSVALPFLGLMIRQHVWYVPTLELDESAFAYAEQQPWTQTPFVQAGLSPELKARFADADWRKKTLADKKTAAARKSLEVNLKNLKRIADHVENVGFGTDSGAAPERVAGIAEHRELALMVQAGLTNQQTLRIATSKAAALLGLTDRGTLAAGQRADFVILGSDPIKDINATTDIVEVWHRGKKVSH